MQWKVRDGLHSNLCERGVVFWDFKSLTREKRFCYPITAPKVKKNSSMPPKVKIELSKKKLSINIPRCRIKNKNINK